MISRLVLREWRNYENVAIDFDEGTTFVVAVNGVGKTSLVEAARYALFGTIASPAAAAVRSGHTTASAAVDLELPSGRKLTVTRQLVKTKTTKRVPPADPDVLLNGSVITPSEFADIITSEYGSEPSFLSRLTMPGADGESPTTLGLEEHLGRFYGVHSLRAAVDELARRSKAIEKRIMSVKADNAASAKQLDAFIAAVKDAETATAAAVKAHDDNQTRLEQAQQDRATLAQATQWDDAAQQRAARLAYLAEAFTQLTGEPNPADESLIGRINTAVEVHRTTTTGLGVRIGVVEATIAALQANLERLNDTRQANEDCPVCRRPLDEETALQAAAGANTELASLISEVASLEEQRASADADYETLIDLQRQGNGLRTLPFRPNVSADVATDQEFEALAAAQTVTFESLVAARADLTQAKQTLEAAREANEAMRQLTALFSEHATVTVALDATQATLDEILTEAVKPLASAVNERWTKLFPDRGPLRTSSDGTVTRTVNGEPLPSSAFSAGEVAGLNLLVRLVVASMATNATFCWFDEPLEHMDPDTRRYVASMLARAGSGEGPMRQIVLTTYEESLARQLNERDPNSVHLRDVR